MRGPSPAELWSREPDSQVWLEGAANTLQPTPRGDRELKAVIALTLRLSKFPKSLKTWSGRRGSNPRRPTWESGIKLRGKQMSNTQPRRYNFEYDTRLLRSKIGPTDVGETLAAERPTPTRT